MPLRVVCASSAGRLCPLWCVRDPSVDVSDPRGVCDPLGPSMPPSRAGCDPSQDVRPSHGVPQLPSRGVSALPLTAYLCLSYGLSRDICAPSRDLPRSGTESRSHPAFLPAAPSLVSLPLSAVVLRGLFRASVGEGLFSRFLGGEAARSPVSVTAASGDLQTFPLAGAALHPRGPRETGGSWVSAEPAGSVGHVRSFVLCFICHIPFPFHRAGQQRNPRGIAFRGSHSRAPACAPERENE